MSLSLYAPGFFHHPNKPTSVTRPNSNFTEHYFPLLETRKTWSKLREIEQLHAQMIITGHIQHPPSLIKLISQAFLINPSGPEYAVSLFARTERANVVIWNNIFRGFVNHKMPKRALLGYIEMLLSSSNVPDRFTFPSLLKACAQLFEFKTGTALHGQVIKLVLDSDLYILTSLVNLYASKGDVCSSRLLFDKMGSKKNNVVWTCMISGYAKNHYPKEALILYDRMERETELIPDGVTMASLISACSELGDLKSGKRLHLLIGEMGMRICSVLGSALIDMYANCGEMEISRKLFDELPERDVYAWSAMIFGYVKNNRSVEGLKLFREMVVNSSHHSPNEVTILAVISACAQLGDLESGRWVHRYIKMNPNYRSMNLQNSLIDMYSKCGEINTAREMFNHMSQRDLITWNSMINGLALHGLGFEALALFDQMQKAGLKPDDITFIGVISACSHAGLIEEGRQYFNSMKDIYGINPKLEHYGCMVDLLCRGGLLKEARKFIGEMHMKPNGAIWGSMLNGARVYNDIGLGEEAARKLVKLEPGNDGVYVLLSNIYAKRKMWAEVRKVRELMNAKGILKRPGFSSIVVNGVSHSFLAGDCTHPEREEVFTMLREVSGKLKMAGYVPETSEVLLNINEEDKEVSISQHSEKLALCYGLLRLEEGTEILIMKNLRICSDCHSAFKLVSKIYRRDITVRDRSRFHHFQDGSCSCRDYW